MGGVAQLKVPLLVEVGVGQLGRRALSWAPVAPANA
jgi:hypothetical protein